MGLRMENFEYFGGSLKNRIFRGGGGHEKTNIEGGGISEKGGRGLGII